MKTYYLQQGLDKRLFIADALDPDCEEIASAKCVDWKAARVELALVAEEKLKELDTAQARKALEDIWGSVVNNYA